MKIAFLNLYSGINERGAETWVKEIADRLSNNNQVSVFQSGEVSGREKYNVYKIPMDMDWKVKSKVGKLSSKFFLDFWSRKVLYFTIKIIPILAREKFDIVIPINGGWQPALVRLVTWLYGGKMVICGHAGIGWDDLNSLWTFPDMFVALSSYAKEWARRSNPFIKVNYVPNGVDLKKFKPEGNVIKLQLKKPIVLCVGALTESKRIDLAIKAVAKLPKVSLMVVGDGDLRSDISSLGKRLLKKRFMLIKIPFERMPEVYRLADVFTIPSEAHHSFEIVLVEAMASGLGVVANDDPIRKEVVGDAGILVDPLDTDTYSKAIWSALNSKWGNKSRNRAQRFSWDKVRDNYEELFRSLI